MSRQSNSSSASLSAWSRLLRGPDAFHIAHTPNATTEANSDSFAKDAEAEKSVLGSQNERVPKRTPCPRFSPISVCTMILYRFSLSSVVGDGDRLIGGERAQSIWKKRSEKKRTRAPRQTTSLR